MKNYTIKSLIKVYNEKQVLGNWYPYKDVSVEAESIEKAKEKASKEILESLVKKDLKVGDFLIDKVIEEGKDIDYGGWDEEVYPVKNESH